MDITAITNLGVAGFAILVMWWMYKHSSEQFEKKDFAMRSLEKEVRDTIVEQLKKNTDAFNRVLEHFSLHK